MAIAIDNSGGQSHAAGTSATQSFTVGTGNNRKLFVSIEGQNGDTVTGVTYAGVAMTLAVKRQSAFSSSFFEYIYYLDNPTSGANNIVVSFSSSSSSNFVYASYTGCALGLDSTVNSIASAVTTFAQSFTTVANNAWTLNMVRTDAGGSTPTAGTGATLRSGVTGDNGMKLFDSNGAITPAGSYTMNYTDGGVSSTFTSVGVSFAPYTGLSFDGSGSSRTGSGSSLSYSVTTTGTNRVLIVQVQQNHGTDTITGVTYGGVAMTRIFGSNPTNLMWTYVYVLYAPTIGTNSVAISASASSFIASTAMSYFGSAQSGNFLNVTNNGSASNVTSTSVTVTPTNIGSFIVGFGEVASGANPTAGANTVLRVINTLDGNSGFDSNGPVGSLSAYTLNMNFTSSPAYMQGLEVLPLSTAVTPSVSDATTTSESVTILAILRVSVSDITTTNEFLSLGNPITYDNSASFSSILTSISNSYTVGVGANRFLIAFIYSASNVLDINPPTYGGVAMLKVADLALPAGYPGYMVAYSLPAPASGSNTFAVSRSGTGTVFVASVLSYYNVFQENADTFGTNTALLVNSITATVSTDEVNEWTIMAVVSGLAATISAGTGSTARTSTTPIAAFDSNGPIAAIGPHSMTANSSSSVDGMAAIIVGIDPFVWFNTQPYILTADDTFVLENVSIVITPLSFSVSDTTTTSESVTLRELTTIQISVSDSTTTSEGPDVGVPISTSNGPDYSTVQTNTSAGVNTNSWGNINNLGANDGQFATVSLTGSDSDSYYADTTGYGFGIPSTATIVGIVAEVSRKCNGNAPADEVAQLIIGGTASGTNKAPFTTIIPTSLTTVTYGSPTDLWGLTPAPSDINSSSFGFRYQVGLTTGVGSTVSADFIRLTVYYTVPVGIPRIVTSNVPTVIDSISVSEGPGIGTTNTASILPTSGTDDSSVGVVSWTNPGNITLDDGSYATASLAPDTSRSTHYLVGNNYGFHIPFSATIQGIIVTINRLASNASTGDSVSDSRVVIRKSDGSYGTTNKAIAGMWPISLTTQSYGGSSDLWGGTWSPSDINSTNFGAAISSALSVGNGGVTASVDSIQIIVYYTVGIPLIVIVSNVSVSDSTTTSESVAVQTTSSISTFDSATTSEFITFGGTIVISVADSTATSESIVLLENDFVSVSDSTATSEAISFVTDNSISIFDSTTTSESVVLLLVSPISVFDTTSTSEAISFISTLKLSVFDSTATSESVALTLAETISVSDATATSESISFVTVGQISVFDATTTSESVAIVIQQLLISVSDSTSISEGIFVLTFEDSNIFDSTLVSENVQMLVTSPISVSDSTTTSESVTIHEVNSFSVFDATITSEFVSLVDTFTITVFDTTTTSENIQMVEGVSISVFDNTSLTDIPILGNFVVVIGVDSVTTSESVSMMVSESISVSDAIATSEAITIHTTLRISVFDTIVTSESVQVMVVIPLFVSDSVTTLESVALMVKDMPNVFDTTTVSEFITIKLTSSESIFDSVTTSESVTLNIEVAISVFDSTVIGEKIAIVVGEAASIFDTVMVSEAITIALGEMISVADTVTTAEEVQFVSYLQVSVFDVTTVSENVRIGVIVPVSIGMWILQLGFAEAPYTLRQDKPNGNYVLQLGFKLASYIMNITY